MISGIVKQPTAVQHWIEEFPFLHDNDFEDFFMIAHKVGDVKLQCFQYKILNRIFPCNYMLKKWKISDTDKCLCGEIDTIEHSLFYCNESRKLWENISQWVNEIFHVKIPLRIVNVLLGIPHRQSQDNVLDILNFMIIHGKWYIHCCKKKSKNVVPRGYLYYMKHVFHIKIEIMSRKGISCNQWKEVVQNLKAK
jgi:hypothetical protein